MMMATANTAPVGLPHYNPHVTLNPNFKALNNDRSFKNHPTLSLIEQCSDIQSLKQIHARMLRNGLFFDKFSASKLVYACAMSKFSTLEYARKVFDEIPDPNVHSWTTMIRAYSSSQEPVEGLLMFIRMLYQSVEAPNKFTFPFVIKAAAEVFDLQFGRGLQGMVVKLSLSSDVYILNSLIYFYAACGDLDMANRVFINIRLRDVVSWNSMISAFAQGERLDDAIELFHGMQADNVMPDVVTLVSVVSACAKKLDLELGRKLHLYIERNGISSNLNLSNAMLDMHAKCGCIKEAEEIFDNMPEKDIVSWTTMIVGYAKSGDYVAARRVFDEMPSQEIAAWNALISAYEQMGKPKEALNLFQELQRSKKVKPNELTLVSTLSACAELGVLSAGSWIHEYMKKENIKLTNYLATSLIDMYSKCGDLESAVKIFNSKKNRDVFVWSAMIASYAMHGHGSDALRLFLKMQEYFIKPNAVTFTNLLCACSHAGLVQEGRTFFSQMKPVYKVEPGPQHYSCMVDILGRAGHLEEAMELIKNMHIAPSVSVWGALLGACKLHGNIDLAEQTSKELLKLDPKHDGAHVLLSNIYTKFGESSKGITIRKQMRELGLKKEKGSSSIEVYGKVHEFFAADTSHSSSGKIYDKLDEVFAKLKSVGYVQDKSDLLQTIEEEDDQERALHAHSEKLAMAFGLISLNQTQPIRVIKNLRVCGDCHNFAKIVSKLYDKEIFLRDRYRFHHFKGGECSCNDYW